jgi:zinc ribbon protein
MPTMRSSDELLAARALATSAQIPVRSPSAGTVTTIGWEIDLASASLVRTATTRSGTRSPGRMLTDGIRRSRRTAASSAYKTGSRVAKATCRRLNAPEDGHIAHILYRRVATCPQCGSPADEGQLFCRKCGATVPQSPALSPPFGAAAMAPPPPPNPLPPPPPPRAGPAPPPPPPPPIGGSPPAPDWIPAGLVGRAVHCARCNSLISAVAVVCPVCLSAQSPRAGAGEDVAPAR